MELERGGGRAEDSYGYLAIAMSVSWRDNGNR
jgi:hypothetical protein